MSKSIMLLALAGVAFLTAGLMIHHHFKVKPFSKKLLSQLLFGNTFICVFYLCAVFSKATVYVSPNWRIAWGIATIPSWLVLAFLRWNVRNRTPIPLLSRLKRHIWEIVLVLLTLFSRFWLIGSLQKWDSSEYYYAIMRIGERFDFSLGSFATAFRLLSHPSYGFAMWAALGEYILPQNVAGVLTVSLLLTCAANVCIYNLLQNYWTELSPRQAFLGTVMCTVIPLYWCSMSCTMPDYYMTIFLVFMLYADHKDDHFMLFFWGTMAAFCKEVGIVLVASFFAAKAICYFFEGRKSVLQRFKRVLLDRSIHAGLCVGGIVIAYFLLSRRLSAWSHSVYYSDPISWSGSSELIYNTFGIQKDNIFTRLQEYFLINFAWVLTGGLLLAVVIYIIGKVLRYLRKKDVKAQFHGVAIIETSAILLAYGAFMCLYITAGSIRYNVVFTLLYAVVAFAVIAKAVGGKIVTIGISVLSMLFAVQSFYSIDVVTNRLFTTVDVGDTQLLYVSQNSHLNPGGDYYITNLQYRSMHENFEKMFSAIDLQPEDTILIAGSTYAETAHNSALSELCGRHDDIRWIPEEGRLRNTISEDGFLLNTLTTNGLWGLNQFPCSVRESETSAVRSKADSLRSGRVFVYFSPLFQSQDNYDELISQLERVFIFGDMVSVETDGNVLSYCQLILKPEEEWQLSSHSYRESGTVEEIVLQRFYRSFRREAIEYDGSRTVIEPGDQLSVTIACYSEDGEFLNMGTSPKGTILNSLYVGTGNNLYGIDDALIGQSIGDTVRVTCTVPSDYRFNRSLEGQTIVMDITINGIVDMLPEITDQLCDMLFSSPTVSAYIDSLCSRMGISSQAVKDIIFGNLEE